MKRNISKSFAVLVMVLMLIGCANTGTTTTAGADQDFITNSYNALSVAGQAYDKGMTAIGTMYKAGQFSEENKVKAVAVATIYKAKYEEAVDALVLYSKSPTAANKLAVQTKIGEATAQVAAITALQILNSTK
ncbi:MAG: hypothetical protein ABFC98_05985 [Candidatus Cloacimonas sp.]